ncbi:MAG: alkaline phosphatase [Methanolobus sp.]|jgi:alkaline phosphatase|uniref:alkaline phosphatase n=1 Tax=unclassified Methanolobus TaxID=2629569 RepID=UPI0024ABA051|nr:alkaline phosphatase [Methanolobus sp.]MDI3485272.1 alkaline phosphatase [Methanolobus sp.]MDK2832206.1 alkaline phosphatase [Methanolobus sp.]MDK2940023.1 alkaline phosphatase [Methanolobus sp.]
MDKRHNLLFALFVVFMLVLGSAAPAVAANNSDNKPNDGNSNKKINNVIVMVPDGCDQNIQTLARWYSGEELQLDSMYTGMVSTNMANSVITGSAAAATAFATGEKTTVRFLGVGPRAEDLLSIYDAEDMAEPYVPLATVLEGAKLEGKATGLIATSSITHATPAAFAVHVHDRGMDSEIMEHIVYQDIDVVFAGGEQYLDSDRNDGEDLKQVLLDEGYQYVTTTDEMEAVTTGQVWGMFASKHMQPEMSRETTEEPSIVEMTEKAIELLSEDEDGFFLMVEGSQVDWAGHANDPEYMVTDFLAFDEAVKAAVNFAEEDGHTLVIVFPDHNTGGMTIGNYDTSYTDLTVEELVDPLKGEEGTVEIGWTTGGHAGGDVPLWAYGPDKPTGLLDNTELATCVADAFGFNLEDVGEELFVEVDEAYPGIWSLDLTDNDNPVVVIERRGVVAELPVSKDILIIDDTEYDLEGVVVGVPMADGNSVLTADDDFYIPQEAVDIIDEKISEGFSGRWSLDLSDSENPAIVFDNDSVVVKYLYTQNILIIGDEAFDLIDILGSI